MKPPRIVVAIASLAVAVVFLLFDVYDVNLMLGETRVAIYPVAFFGLLGVLLLARPWLSRWLDRWRYREPPSEPRMKRGT